MKLRFRVGRTDGRTHGRTNGDIEALADAMRALKNCEISRYIIKTQHKFGAKFQRFLGPLFNNKNG